MITCDRRTAISDALHMMDRHECVDMFARYQALAECIYSILVKDKTIKYDVAGIHKRLDAQRLEEFADCGLMEDDVIIALAFLIYGNDVDCVGGKFCAH